MSFPICPELELLNRVNKELSNLYHEIALRLNLSDSAFDVFYAICILGDGCLQRDICDVSYLSKQTIHSSIRRLEQEGYLTLAPGRGRSRHIRLTPSGQVLVRERILPVIAAEQDSLADLPPEDCQALIRLQAHYAASLRQRSQALPVFGPLSRQAERSQNENPAL